MLFVHFNVIKYYKTFETILYFLSIQTRGIQLQFPFFL